MEQEETARSGESRWVNKKRADPAVDSGQPERKTGSSKDNNSNAEVWEEQLDVYASQNAAGKPPARLTTIPIPKSRRPILTQIERTAERLLCFVFWGAVTQFACGIREAAMRRIPLCLCFVVLSFFSIFGGIRTVWNCSRTSVMFLTFLLVFDVVVCIAVSVPRIVKAIRVAGVLPPRGCQYHAMDDDVMVESLAGRSCREFILHSTIINGCLFILTALLFAIAAACCVVLLRQVSRWRNSAEPTRDQLAAQKKRPLSTTTAWETGKIIR